MRDKAVVLMYYGFPEEREEMREYLKDILHGREPPESLVKENIEKLDTIGGRSPSTEIVKRIREKVEKRLEREGFSVYLLSKHYKPSLKDTSAIVREEVVYAVPLFPVYSKFIFDGYFSQLEGQLSGRRIIRIRDIGFDPEIIDFYKSRIGKSEESILTFSAHSIPMEGYDPYSEAIRSLSEKIAGNMKFINIYHSQGPFHSKWLTPYPEYSLKYARENGYRGIQVVPIGFIYEHLEVLYDLDYELREKAERESLEYKRVPLPNDSDVVIDSICNLVRKEIANDFR